MKFKTIITDLCIGTALLTITPSCTDLTENVYDQTVTANYYQTHDDVIRAFLRPFEHGFWSITSTYRLQEITADQIGTWERDGWWYDGGQWERLHDHTWGLEGGEADIITGCWNGFFQGIGQCNSVLEDFARLDPVQYGFTTEEFDALESQIHVMRAWFYIRALDLFRNLPLIISFSDQSKNTSYQLPPKEIFNFIETELLEALPLLPLKEGNSGNGVNQGQWNQGSAAALLVRLYLNAEKWIGEARYDDCARVAQEIIDSKYGYYALDEKWDRPFDWNNETSNEVLFAYTSSYGYSHWHMTSDMYWWGLPSNAHYYFGFTEWGGMNPGRGVQPGHDVDGNLYHFDLGTPIPKFQKYPEDVRLKKYVNLSGTSQREGMFLYGYLPYADGSGEHVKSPVGDYPIYLRDQVGKFGNTEPGTVIDDKESSVTHGDMNSGWCCVKYPIYRDDDPGAMESDYVEIRLAEIYYSLAECKFRQGDITGAGKLLNAVRKRNYPESTWTEYLYQPEGKILLTEGELLDEWGREFLDESRRRTDLCRWNKFSSSTWWDKQPDADNHTDIFILTQKILGANPDLKQNPGYPDIAR